MRKEIFKDVERYLTIQHLPYCKKIKLGDSIDLTRIKKASNKSSIELPQSLLNQVSTALNLPEEMVLTMERLNHISYIESGISLEKYLLKFINFPNLDEKNRKNLQELFDLITNYLSYPIIVDDFETHDDRRVWRKALDKEWKEVFSTNRLRVNKLSSIGGLISFILYVYNEEGVTLDEVFLKDLERVKKKIDEVKGSEASQNNRKELFLRKIFMRFSKHKQSSVYDKWSIKEKIEFIKQISSILVELRKQIQINF